ncbi:sigma-54-dependent Fis family transcriptional regulator [Archangium gephyra]|nr:sigma-54-dependent Fis family transcriptional regulator [Archangium gephyra]
MERDSGSPSRARPSKPWGEGSGSCRARTGRAPWPVWSCPWHPRAPARRGRTCDDGGCRGGRARGGPRGGRAQPARTLPGRAGGTRAEGRPARLGGGRGGVPLAPRAGPPAARREAGRWRWAGAARSAAQAGTAHARHRDDRVRHRGARGAGAARGRGRLPRQTVPQRAARLLRGSRAGSGTPPRGTGARRPHARPGLGHRPRTHRRRWGLRDVAALLPRVAASDATVLVRGESGTGKELVARAIHAASPRLDGPFVSVNCAALPSSLLESELFGFERGAFTGAHSRRKGLIEAAEGGTLFLDEIGDMSLEAQARLLRVLQEREITRIGGREAVKVDLRVISATHRDLDAMASSGQFRSDLLYRLAVIPIHLPPLRERTRDIPGLIEHFLEKHARSKGLTPPRPDAETSRRALTYAWPGNVRELENFVERAVVLGHFDPESLRPPMARRGAPGPVAAPAPAEVTAVGDGPTVQTLRDAVASAERAAVIAALQAAKGQKTTAARLLGVSYKTLFNKIHEHGIREELHIG